MNRTIYFALDYYDRQVIQSIMDKYAMEPMDALRSFLTSETHELLEDMECGLWSFPARGVFDMWEAEKITGDPRNSIYVRGE